MERRMRKVAADTKSGQQLKSTESANEFQPINFGSAEDGLSHVRAVSIDSEILENYKMIDGQRQMLRQKGTENLHLLRAMQKSSMLQMGDDSEHNMTTDANTRERQASPLTSKAP